MKFFNSFKPFKLWSILSKSTGVIALVLSLVSLYCGAWMLYTGHAISAQRDMVKGASSSKNQKIVTVDVKAPSDIARPVDWSVIAPQAQASTVLIQVAAKPYRRGRQLVKDYYFNPILDAANVLYRRINGFDDDEKKLGWRVYGAGVYVGDNLIMTAAHVVTEYHIFHVVSADGTQGVAKVAAFDPLQDLAILEIVTRIGKEKTPFAPVAKFADTSRIPAGSPVIAIGSPAGEPFIVTAGVIMSTKQRHDQFLHDDFVEFDAKIRGGSSGGGVFNRNGELIGITSFGNDFAGYAVPIDRAKIVLKNLINSVAPAAALTSLN